MIHFTQVILSGASLLALGQAAAAQGVRARAQDMFAPLP